MQMYLGVMHRDFLDVEARGSGTSGQGQQKEADQKDSAAQGVDLQSIGRLSSGSSSHPALSKSSLKR